MKNIINGKIYIKASFNNTLIYITDLKGNVIKWATSSKMGFKGSRKSTPYAAQIASKKVCLDAKNKFNLKNVDIFVRGPGPGRESAIRSASEFFKIISINDITGIPYNGCRPPKERRV